MAIRPYTGPMYRGKYAEQGIWSSQHWEDENQYTCPAFAGWLAWVMQQNKPMASEILHYWGKAINGGIVLG